MCGQNWKRSKRFSCVIWLFRLGLIIGVCNYVYFRFEDSVRVVAFPDIAIDRSVEPVASIHVGAYNIAHGRGPVLGESNWKYENKEGVMAQLLRIAGFIRGLDLDVVVLNEVDFASVWSHHINQAEVIAKHAGYAYLVEQRNYNVAIPFFNYKFGNAVLSRYPIENVKSVLFPPSSQWESAFAGNHNGVLCDVVLGSGKRVRVLAVHLEYRKEDVRVKCANHILSLEKESALPFIALGDFNSSLPEFALSRTSKDGKNAMDILLRSQQFRFYHFDRKHQYAFTFPSEKPDRVIDWIICSKSLSFENFNVLKSDLSDHLPITARILLND